MANARRDCLAVPKKLVCGEGICRNEHPSYGERDRPRTFFVRGAEREVSGSRSLALRDAFY